MGLQHYKTRTLAKLDRRAPKETLWCICRQGLVDLGNLTLERNYFKILPFITLKADLYNHFSKPLVCSSKKKLHHTSIHPKTLLLHCLWLRWMKKIFLNNIFIDFREISRNSFIHISLLLRMRSDLEVFFYFLHLWFHFGRHCTPPSVNNELLGKYSFIKLRFITT